MLFLDIRPLYIENFYLYTCIFLTRDLSLICLFEVFVQYSDYMIEEGIFTFMFTQNLFLYFLRNTLYIFFSTNVINYYDTLHIPFKYIDERNFTFCDFFFKYLKHHCPVERLFIQKIYKDFLFEYVVLLEMIGL